MHPCAGAPIANTTLFCDINSTFCYSITASPVAWTTASTDCQALGGNLISYTSEQEQQMVEVSSRSRSRSTSRVQVVAWDCIRQYPTTINAT